MERSANPVIRVDRRRRCLRTMRPRWTVVWLLSMVPVLPCVAQDIEPRRWSHLPIGSNSVTLGYVETTGEIFFNPVLRIEDAEFGLDSFSLKYIRSFDWCGKSARVDLLQVWQEGDWNGILDGVPASTSRKGWADTTVRLAVNLIGAPPLAGTEFAAYRARTTRETIVGAALAVQLPTGDYMGDKLINLGNNRFTFTPQLGVVRNHGKWSTELTASASLFTDNDSFFNGRLLAEDPFFFLQGHVVYNFRPGLWLAASGGYGYGGESTIDGESADDRSKFVAWGVALGIPLNRSAGVKIGYIGSRTKTDTGSDTDTVLVGLGLMW